MERKQQEKNKCSACAFFMIYDHTCAFPGAGWPRVDIDAPACPEFEPETIGTPET